MLMEQPSPVLGLSPVAVISAVSPSWRVACSMIGGVGLVVVSLVPPSPV
jgi:hypothetical protein